MKNTKKEEIRRRMSHGELLRGFNNGNSGTVNNGNNGSFNGSFNGSSNGGFNRFSAGSNNGSFSGFNNRSLNQGPDVQSQSSNGEETVFFDAQVGQSANKYYSILNMAIRYFSTKKITKQTLQQMKTTKTY